MKLVSMIAMFTICGATGVAQDSVPNSPDVACLELHEAAMRLAASGHLAEAEALLPAVPVSGGERGQEACTGRVLGNLARIAAVMGYMADAERLAERSVRILEKFYPRDHWVMLRPLQILAAVRLESGRTARAREAVRIIQSIRTKLPEDRALVHAITGSLLQSEGRQSEAETEYQEAFRAWEEAGRGESADAAVILHCLSALYLEEHRLEEARLALDRALVIHDRAKDSYPVDRIKFLNLRSVLHARLGEWQQSEQDLRDALDLADRQPYVDPALLRLLLDSYCHVLRKNHHRREARSIDARRASLPTNGTAAAVVDATELRMEKNAGKRGAIR